MSTFLPHNIKQRHKERTMAVQIFINELVDKYNKGDYPDISLDIQDELTRNFNPEDLTNFNIPNTLQNVLGDLVLNWTDVTSLPENLHIRGDLHLIGSDIRALPKGLKVGGYIKTQVCKLLERIDKSVTANAIYFEPYFSRPFLKAKDFRYTPFVEPYMKESNYNYRECNRRIKADYPNIKFVYNVYAPDINLGNI